MKPILYSYYRSSCSYRVRIALNIKKIDYDYKSVHLVKDGGEQFSDQYQELNPKSEVPFLIHGDAKIAQSMAIIDYIDNAFDGPDLFSKNLEERAKTIQLCEVINSGIQPLQNLKVLKDIVKRFEINDEQKAAWGKYWIEEGFNALEEMLKSTSGKYSMGDQLSAVDCFLVPQVFNANRFNVDLNQYPKIKSINENCLKTDEITNAAPEKQDDAV